MISDNSKIAAITARLLLMLLLLVGSSGAFAQEGAHGYVASIPDMPGDSLRVSIVTCWPGAEIYELEGHEAIRVSAPSFDYVWNYGTFDFAQPNFVGRFVAGQTDYMVQAYPFSWFLPEYNARGSRVEEQELLLTPAEKERLLANLKRNILPENNTYRYNYVKDNCATRITAMLDTTLDRRIVFPDTVRYGTFRRVMRHYHHNYPWYQFGIDLVLGSGIDRPISRAAEMFAPVEMHNAYASARFANNGGAVTAPAVVLNEGSRNAVLPPTAWYLTPTAFATLALLICIAVCMLWWRRKLFARWWFSLYFGLCGIAGCLVAYLVFFSAHEATSPNLMLVWLNPLQLIVALGIWWRTWRFPVSAVALYNAIAIPVLLLIWPSQLQVASVPIFLLMFSLALLSVLYIIIAIKKSYYNNMGLPSRNYNTGFLTPSSPKKTSKTSKQKAPAKRGRTK